MTGPELAQRLRVLLADLVGTYRDPDLGPAFDRPAVGYGDLPESITCTGLEAHVDDLPTLEVLPAYRHEVGIGRSWTVRLSEHDGTPAGALQSATGRVVATFRAPAPVPLPADDRLGMLRQVILTITE
jgi:hypothetical protein